jgi:hypothetical protein
MAHENIDTQNLKIELNKRYKNADIKDILDNNDGSVSIILSGNPEKINAALNRMERPSYNELPVLDKEDVSKLRSSRNVEYSSTVRRDVLGPSYMDLTTKPSVLEASPQDLYKRAMDYYKTEDVYGSSVDILTNFASKGFKNDIDDDSIKNFYDNWVLDSGFDKIVEQIFFEFFRSGFVRTYKIISKYVPKINYLSTIPGQEASKIDEAAADKFMKELAEKKSKERSAKKIKWSKDYIPIKYTILNPTLIEVQKQSLLLDQQFVILKAEALAGIKVLLETKDADLTDTQRDIIKNIPSDMKDAAKDGKDLPLDPYLVGAVDYRRQPYELYPFPRGVRAFESMEYKKSLRAADYSTLDGITNFILAITIGNDDFPVKSQDQLEAVASLFDTPSKAFNVVWDHTLKVQRIEPSDVGNILGQDKYKQVNDDITGAFGVIRALIDGVGAPSKAGADLAVKALIEEIAYARREVARWIYKEYRDIAEAMSFNRYPKIRFDNMILKDEIMMMNIIQGMLDRRIIPYQLGHELLNYDYDTLVAQMKKEKDLVIDGTLGIIGSPYQRAAQQDVQLAPNGTPSEGRPKGKVSKTPTPTTKPAKPKPKKDKVLEAAFGNTVEDMSAEDMSDVIQFMRAKLIEKISDEEN